MYVTHYKDRMINGNAPTLTTIRLAYGENALYDWTNIYLVDVANFFGKTDKANAYQLYQISQSIYESYPYLKVTELMLFFSMFKGGLLKSKSGCNTAKMYGSFDGASIMEGLDRFMEYRSQEIDKHIQAENARKRAEWDAVKSDVVSTIYDDIRNKMARDAEEKRKKRAAQEQKTINEHNKQFLDMLKSKEYIKQ